MKKLVLLKGEGTNLHVLHGDFEVLEQDDSFTVISVNEPSLLKHETPEGYFSQEHKTLNVPKGSWVMGKQVEWNPFSAKIVDIWD